MPERITGLLKLIHTVGARSRDKSRFSKEPRRLRYESLEDRRMLATLIVNSLEDDITIDDGDLLLREAIDYVNGRIPGSLDTESDGVIHIDESENLLGYNDIILFDPSLVALGATITLDNNLGHLQLEQTVTIDATALPNGITIDANSGSRVFYINNPGPDENDIYNITLAGLTITGGNTAGYTDVEVDGYYYGGGIFFRTDRSDYTFSILDSKIVENHAHQNPGIGMFGDGGGVYIVATEYYNYDLEFNMAGTIVQGNTANCGGGVFIYYPIPPGEVERSVTIEDCTFLGNTAWGNGDTEFGSAGGGGLFARHEKSTLTISESTFQGNISNGSGAKYGGGGIHVELGYTEATLKLENSTVSGNTATASNGGGVWINSKYGDFECTQNTISDNRALFGAGGGLWLSQSDSTKTFTAYLNHTTITNNHSPSGGGLYSQNSQYVSTTLNHTIVSGNDDGSINPNNIAGAIEADSSYNLIGWGPGTHPNGFPTGSGNIYDTDNNPDLRQLGYYGGPMQTHMPLAASEVIDAGDHDAVAGVNNVPRYDQRGRPFNRILDGNDDDYAWIDIGAVEYGIGDPDDAPTIVDVVISGSQSVHDDYSFSGKFDEGNHPFSTVPVGGADTIEIVFSEWVDVVKTDLYLVGNYPPIINYTEGIDWEVVDFVFDEETFTARWMFGEAGDEDPDPFPADMLEIRLNQEGKYIVDHDYNQLDGEWTPPYGVDDDPPEGGWQLPSGNGVAGGEFVFRFVILPGDADLDNDVDNYDFLTWLMHFGLNENGTFLEGDFDGDGDVDGSDFLIWQENFGLDFTWWDYYNC